MQAPVPASVTTETPGGLSRTVTESRAVALADPLNPLSLQSATTTRRVNGLAFTQAYTTATRTLTETTPVGRVRTTVLDPQGRVASTQVAGLAPVSFGRDPTGLLTTITEGTGPTARTTTLAYDPHRRLQTITDPVPRTVSFTYDDADRVLTQTFPSVPMSGETVPTGYLCTDGRRMANPTCRNHSQFLVVEDPSRPSARSVIAV